MAQVFISYDPALVSDPSQLSFVRQAQPDAPDLAACWVQTEPAHQIPNLKGIPILVLIAEASYATPYYHCVSKYLTQAGVRNTLSKDR